MGRERLCKPTAQESTGNRGFFKRPGTCDSIMKTINPYMPNQPALRGYSTVPATSDAKEYLRLLLSHKLGLLMMLLLGILLATLYLISATPVYEAKALIEVQERGGVAADPVTTTDWNRPPVTEEVNIMLSRPVLMPVVEQFNLVYDVQPKKMPVLGEVTERVPALGSWLSGQSFASSYAWNKEALEIGALTVPFEWEDEALTFTSLGNGSYSVAKDGQMLIESAQIGEPLIVELNPLDPMELVVTSIQALEGVEFEVVRKSTQETVSQLQSDLRAETSDEDSRMISVFHRNENPADTANLLNAIAYQYRDVKLGADSNQSNEKLKFIEESLPAAKREMEAAEAALAAFRVQRGAVNVDLKNDLVMRETSRLESQLNELLFERDELKERYTDVHPSLRKLNKEIDAMQRRVNVERGKISSSPVVQRDLGQLELRAETARRIFSDLDERYQLQRNALGGNTGSVRIWDEAQVPKKPISPNSLLALVAATLGTIFCYVVYLTLRSALSTVINDQESLERSTGLPVFMNIPRSNAQKRLGTSSGAIVDPRRMLPGSSSAENMPAANVLAIKKPDDYSVENLRGLRSMLDDVMDDASSNVLMICSPLPAMGKSFVSMNIAVLLAQTGKRVLLIDADYQRGQIHKSLGVSQGPGLPEVVKGKSELKESVRATSVPNLYAIPRGFIGEAALREAPTEKEFGAFLQVVAPRFDIAIIDTPPILSVSTAATIGRHAGASLMVVKEGEVTEGQMNEALKRLSFSGVTVNGCLMNNSTQAAASHYAYYREQLD